MSSLAIWRIIYFLSEIIKEQIEENTWGELKEIHRVNYKIQRGNCKKYKRVNCKNTKGRIAIRPYEINN